MHADLDALLTASYVLIDDFLPEGPHGPGRPAEITDAEVTRNQSSRRDETPSGALA